MIKAILNGAAVYDPATQKVINKNARQKRKAIL